MERCEWNPKYDVPAMSPAKEGDCPNEATCIEANHKHRAEVVGECARLGATG